MLIITVNKAQNNMLDFYINAYDNESEKIFQGYKEQGYNGYTVKEAIRNYKKINNITSKNIRIIDNYSVKSYELEPLPEQNQKSFYNKAMIKENEDGSESLYSYNMLIMIRDIDGNYIRQWDGWSQTTGKHIRAFSGLNKKQFLNLTMEV